MSTPHLDHAELDGRKWAWAAGCWREWSDREANWLPSPPPPAEAQTSRQPARGWGLPLPALWRLPRPWRRRWSDWTSDRQRW